MNYEVIQQAGAWIVEHNGVEVARFDEQAEALAEVSRRLSEADVGDAGASLAVRYQARTG